MSVLASLVAAYERLEKTGEVPPYGYSSEGIGYLVLISEDGVPVGDPIPLFEGEAKRKFVPKIWVPIAFKRSGTSPKPYFLWDNSAFALGVSAKNDASYGAKRFITFRDWHNEVLAGTTFPPLVAFRRFLNSWSPADFLARNWPEEMRGAKIAFAAAWDRHFPTGTKKYLHDFEEAKKIWRNIYAENIDVSSVCLVTGERCPISRVHPPIKGILAKGASKESDSLVSFNHDAFTSYRHKQGENAPVSAAAAFAYTSVLSRFLAKGSRHSVRIAETWIVFWAEASDDAAAEDAADVFAALMGLDEFDALMGLDEFDDTIPTRKIGAVLEAIRDGRPLAEVRPDLEHGVRFHVLGLAPNAARLSVRYSFDDDFGVLAENFRAYANDLRLAARRVADRPITLRQLVARTAPARRDRNGRLTFDGDRISPLLAGELLRSAMTGTRFPASLLPLLISRVRADTHLDGIRVALVKAAIVRTMRLDGRLPGPFDGFSREDYLVAPQPSDPDVARRLGRVFALIEKVQTAALGEGINSTVKDKFLSAAAATPARTFPALIDGMQAHLKRLRNGHSDAKWITDADMARRVGAKLERRIGTLWAEIGAEVPRQHSAEEQGLFFVGYYQERYAPRAEAGVDATPDIPTGEDPAEEMLS